MTGASQPSLHLGRAQRRDAALLEFMLVKIMNLSDGRQIAFVFPLISIVMEPGL